MMEVATLCDGVLRADPPAGNPNPDPDPDPDPNSDPNPNQVERPRPLGAVEQALTLTLT